MDWNIFQIVTLLRTTREGGKPGGREVIWMHLKIDLILIIAPVILKRTSLKTGAQSTVSFAITASGVRKKLR
jgi:hypothetical protein